MTNPLIGRLKHHSTNSLAHFILCQRVGVSYSGVFCISIR